jgi:D-alanyl-D-alanine dipeptidase
VTKIFWDATPEDKHGFVANPARGSRHNRGCAVDLTLFDLETGNAVEMPSVYDEMSERARPTYTGGTPEQRRLRDHLRAAMEAEGFAVEETEWWHFDYKDWKLYPIGNDTFDKINKKH